MAAASYEKIIGGLSLTLQMSSHCFPDDVEGRFLLRQTLRIHHQALIYWIMLDYLCYLE